MHFYHILTIWIFLVRTYRYSGIFFPCRCPFFSVIFSFLHIFLSSQICLFHFLIIQQFPSCPAQSNFPCFQHICPVRDCQRHLCILFYQQYGNPLLMYFFYDMKNFLHQKRRQSHGRFVHQNYGGTAHQSPSHCQSTI